MTETLKNFFLKREWLIVFLLVIIFVFIRLPGTDIPLHQDEYKWPMAVNPHEKSTAYIPHPPMGEFIYKTAGLLVGFNVNFRFVPLFFGAVNLILLYYLARLIWGRKGAIIASLIWTFSYFSVLASLMVDTDGQIMPFFFILALIAYHKALNGPRNKVCLMWVIFLILALIGGFLVKVSFIIVIGAILADFLWLKRTGFSKKNILKYTLYFLAGVIGLVSVLFVIKLIFPFFQLGKSFVYWKHFFVFNRGWFQIFIQTAKAILYSSPILILTPFIFLIIPKKETFEKIRVFVFFLIFAFIFYIVLFDFSIGALDRYLQLLILPLTMLTTAVLLNVLETKNERAKTFLFFGVITAVVLFKLQFLPHYVPSLHPKSEWISRIMSFKWNFVYPFSGGSGPLGFYVSFLFIAFSWVISLGSIILAFVKPNLRKLIIVFIIPIGIMYNGVFIEEYLFGNINGNASKLVETSAEFIKQNPEIKKVIVYNDNGGDIIQRIGKYERRMYADPAFEQNYRDILSNFNGHLLYIDIPKVDQNSFYKKYISSCEVVYTKTDKKISATVYYCNNQNK